MDETYSIAFNQELGATYHHLSHGPELTPQQRISLQESAAFYYEQAREKLVERVRVLQ